MPGCLILTYIIDKEGSEICSGICVQKSGPCREMHAHAGHTILIYFSLTPILYETIFSIYYSWCQEMEWRAVVKWRQETKRMDGEELKKMIEGWWWKEDEKTSSNVREKLSWTKGFPLEKTKMAFNLAKCTLNYTFHLLQFKWLNWAWFNSFKCT